MAVFCCICGRSIAEKDWDAVPLKDGQTVCKDCADQTRILYPFRYTKVLTESSDFTHVGRFAYHEKIIQGVRIDPLREMTAQSVQARDSHSRTVVSPIASIHSIIF